MSPARTSSSTVVVTARSSSETHISCTAAAIWRRRCSCLMRDGRRSSSSRSSAKMRASLETVVRRRASVGWAVRTRRTSAAASVCSSSSALVPSAASCATAACSEPRRGPGPSSSLRIRRTRSRSSARFMSRNQRVSIRISSTMSPSSRPATSCASWSAAPASPLRERSPSSIAWRSSSQRLGPLDGADDLVEDAAEQRLVVGVGAGGEFGRGDGAHGVEGTWRLRRGLRPDVNDCAWLGSPRRIGGGRSFSDRTAQRSLDPRLAGMTLQRGMDGPDPARAQPVVRAQRARTRIVAPRALGCSARGRWRVRAATPRSPSAGAP